MTRRMGSPQKQRETIMARAREEVARLWEEMETEQSIDSAERDAIVEVNREREARRQAMASETVRVLSGLPSEIAAPSDAPSDRTTSEEENEMSKQRKRTAAPAAKGQAGLKTAQAHRTTKAAQKKGAPGPGPSAKVKRSTTTQAIKAGPPAGSENGAAAHGPNGEHFTRAKAEGVRIVKGNRGGFDVKTFGTLNRALRGLFETEQQALDAAEASGLAVKATPKR